MDQTAAVAAPAGTTPLSLGEKLLIAALVYLLAMRCLFTFFAFPISDEAYYWMWGRHLAIGYFDHPPLEGWLQGLTYAVAGRSLLALRWMTIAATAGTFWIYALVAKRLAGAAWRPLWLTTVTIYMASPTMGFFAGLAFLDYLLVFLMLASGYCFIVFFSDVEATGRGRTRDLMLAALLLGLAGLTKYNGAFLGLAVAGLVLFRPRLRPLLGDWRLYAAGAIALGLQAPWVIWNIQHGFASFRFHMVDRNAGHLFQGVNIGGVKAYVASAVLMVSPFLVPAIIAFFWGEQKNRFERLGKVLAIATFWLSSLLFLYISNYAYILFWWNISAYVLLYPFIGRYVGRGMLIAHIVLGILIVSFMSVSLSVVPVLRLFGMSQGMETENVFGWEKVADSLVRMRDEHGATFFVTNRYQTASDLGFVLDDPSVVAISDRRDAFDDWFDPQTRLGQSAIILRADDSDDAWRGYFATVTDLGDLVATHPWAGFVMRTYRVYLGEGFRPPPATP